MERGGRPIGARGVLLTLVLLGAAAPVLAQATVVELRLRGPDGAPLSRVDVALTDGDDSGCGVGAAALRAPLRGRTDADGGVVFAVPRYGNYWLRVGGLDATANAWPVLPGDGPQVLDVAPAGSLTITLASGDDQRVVEDGRVTLVRAGAGTCRAEVRQASAGLLRIDRVRPGTYFARVVADGHRTTVCDVEVRAGAEARVTAWLVGDEPVTGRVLDERGRPVVGGRLLGVDGSMLDLALGDDGAFDLGLAGGMLMRRVLVLAPGHEPRWVDVAGGAAPLDVTLPRRDPAALLVQRPDGTPAPRAVGRWTISDAHNHRVEVPWRAAADGVVERIVRSGDAVVAAAPGCAVYHGPVAAASLRLEPGVAACFVCSAGPPGRWLRIGAVARGPDGTTLNRLVPVTADGRAFVDNLSVGAHRVVELLEDGEARGPAVTVELDARTSGPHEVDLGG